MTTRNRSLVRAPRRPRQWAITNANGSLVAATHAGQIAFDLGAELEVDIASNLHNVTASALRFNVNYRLTGSTSGDDTTVNLGVGWIGLDAFIAGGVAMPDPSKDHFDWMFHDIRTLTSSRDVTDVDEQVPGSHLVIKNDSMRKQRENHSVLALIVRASLLQVTSCQVFVGGRALLLLP